MNEYIFYTCEGYTYPPREDKEVENCQVIGRAFGENAQKAKENLLKDKPWIEECEFDPEEFICKQLLTEDNKRDIQTIVDYLLDDEYKHFEESEEPDDHIYHTLSRLKELDSYLSK